MRRFFLRRPVAADLLVVAFFLLAGLTDGPGPAGSPTLWVLVALGAVLLLRRRHEPVLVAAGVTVLAVVHVATLGTLGGFELGAAFAMYAIAANRPARTAWTSLLLIHLTLGAATVAWMATDTLPTVTAPGTEPQVLDLGAARLGTVLILGFVLVTSFGIGTSVRNRRQHVADLVERTNRLARERDQESRIARASERARISREMHDVVAHSLSVMITLADGADAALDRSPERAREALRMLSETGRGALGDMRRVLGVLHGDDAPLEPTPGAPDLADLVASVRTAGLPVRCEVTGPGLPEDTHKQLAVYRIVQEALTNTLRYAPGATDVSVEIATSAHGTVVTVTDSGGTLPTRPHQGSGHGIIGMSERAHVYGGTVEAGPYATGWRVRAELVWT